jgi:hypothetical protein
MANKRPRPSKAKRVKAVARKRVGAPKPARALDERQEREQPKHKKRWQDEADA